MGGVERLRPAVRRHAELEALAGVAGVHRAADRHLFAIEALVAECAGRRGPKLGEGAVQRLGVVARALQDRTGHLAGHGGHQHPEGGEEAGRRGHQRALDADPPRQLRHVKSARAAERDQAELAGVVAPLHRDHPQRALHGAVGHGQHSFGCLLQARAHPVGHAPQHGLDRFPVQRCGPPQEPPDGQPPEPHVGVRDGKGASAPPVARRPRLGPGALRPHLEGASGVQPRDAAAPRAHRVDVQHWHRHRLPVDGKLAGPERSSRAQGDVGGRASHVEGDHLVEARSPSPVQRPHHAAGRTGQHGVHWLARGPPHRHGSAVGAHDRDPLRPGPLLDPGQVARDHRRHEGVDHRGGGPFVLAELGQQARRHRHRHATALQRRRHRLLVGRVRVGVQQAHRHRVPRVRPLRQPGQLVGVHRLELRALGVQPSRHAQPVLPPCQRRLAPAHQRVQLGAVLASDLEHVLEAPVGDQPHARALALQKRVGRHRGSVEEDEGTASGAGIRAESQRPESEEHRLAGVRRRRGDLEAPQPAVREHQQVGEGAARVHRHQDRLGARLR